ncbi:MAG: NAD-dependent epimerase/dehydratase family protein [Elusimicrobia bacterium]|nr:NAD-dependent epimerase/dehydratase family protein [Elusimicrobiota bacterium]
MKKALVTGGGGFVGSVLIHELLNKGVETIALDLPKLEERFTFKGKVRFIGADLTDKESVRRCLDPSLDCVFHTAALFKYGVPRDLIHRVNVQGTRNLCEAMVEHGVKRLINWGSSTVYGFWDDPKLVKDETCPINEDGLVENYAWSKRQQEKVGEEFSAMASVSDRPQGSAFSLGAGRNSVPGAPFAPQALLGPWAPLQGLRSGAAKGLLEVTTVRPGDIYGPGTPNGMTHVLHLFKKGVARAVAGYKETYISHVHVDDVALAAIYLAQRPEAAGQIYNLADNYLISGFELLELMARIFKTWALPTRKKTWNVPIFHAPPFLLKLSGMAEELRAKLKGGFASYDRISALYAIKNHILSNRKLLATGYRLKWPDTREALPGVVEHYEKTNWAILRQ